MLASGIVQMQIAGLQCGCCKQSIIFARDGRICPRCRWAAHDTCEGGLICPACGSPLTGYAPTKLDPGLIGYDPRESRSMNAAGAWLASVMSFLLILLFFYLMTLA